MRKIDRLIELVKLSYFMPEALFLLIIVLREIVTSNSIYILGKNLEHLQLLDTQLAEIVVELI